MAAARAFCFYSAMGLLAIMYCPFCVVLGLIAPATGYAITRDWARQVLRLLRVFCGLRYRIHGTIQQQPVLYVCNHQSAWETLALMALLPKACFVLKRELLWIPFFGWGLRSVNPIAIRRRAKNRALRQVIEQGRDRIRQGASIVIFPEGTRHPPGSCGPLQQGYAKVATECACPVVPVAHNAGWFWARRRFTKMPGCVDLVFGEPIQTTGRGTREIAVETAAWLTRQVAALPRPGMAPPSAGSGDKSAGRVW